MQKNRTLMHDTLQPGKVRSVMTNACFKYQHHHPALLRNHLGTFTYYFGRLFEHEKYREK
jgi:hypothetical protein